MIIKSYNVSNPPAQQPSFWIARVGQCGKPLREPYTSNNSFAVYSDQPEIDFQRLKAAYEISSFAYYAGGSVQQAIRIKDVQRVADNAPQMTDKQAAMMDTIDSKIEILLQQTEQMKELKQALMHKISQ